MPFSLAIFAIDLISDQGTRYEAQQLLYSLKKYMAGNHFNPEVELEAGLVSDLFK